MKEELKEENEGKKNDDKRKKGEGAEGEKAESSSKVQQKFKRQPRSLLHETPQNPLNPIKSPRPIGHAGEERKDERLQPGRKISEGKGKSSRKVQVSTWIATVSNPMCHDTQSPILKGSNTIENNSKT